MQWIAPSEKDTSSDTLEKRLWAAADQLRANSGLTSAQYSQPVLGLIFLRFAEVRFSGRRAELEKSASGSRRGSRVDEPGAYHAEGVLYLTSNARFDHLLALPEGGKVGQAVNDAMRDIERHNPNLAGVLPKTYEIFNSKLLKELLKMVSEIPATLDYDAFGQIYEYFLGEFAMTEGHVEVMLEAAGGRVVLVSQLPEVGDERLVPGIDHRRLEPLQQRRVGLAQEPERLAQFPAAEVEPFADRFLDHIAAVLDGEVPIAAVNVDEPDVVVAVLGSKAPGAATRFAGVEDANVVSLLDAAQFLADRIEYFERDHGASFLELMLLSADDSAGDDVLVAIPFDDVIVENTFLYQADFFHHTSRCRVAI